MSWFFAAKHFLLRRPWDHHTFWLGRTPWHMLRFWRTAWCTWWPEFGFCSGQCPIPHPWQWPETVQCQCCSFCLKLQCEIWKVQRNTDQRRSWEKIFATSCHSFQIKFCQKRNSQWGFFYVRFIKRFPFDILPSAALRILVLSPCTFRPTWRSSESDEAAVSSNGRLVLGKPEDLQHCKASALRQNKWCLFPAILTRDGDWQTDVKTWLCEVHLVVIGRAAILWFRQNLDATTPFREHDPPPTHG